MITEIANAKINLYLDVISKRPDGFHGIESVMQTVALADTLCFDISLSDRTEITVTADGASLPMGDGNLAYRAARAYLSAAGICASVGIRIDKKIPIAAGLAGGSADAAATLRAMNRALGRLTAEELHTVAASIGSDVPFCLVGGTAICRGRGELIERLTPTAPTDIVVAIGDDRVSTPAAYARLDGLFRDFDGSIKTGGSEYLDALLRGIENGAPLPDRLFNVFECEIDNFAKSVTKIKAELLSHGASAALMSGSGPSVFGIFKNGKDAKDASLSLCADGYTAFATAFCQ